MRSMSVATVIHCVVALLITGNKHAMLTKAVICGNTRKCKQVLADSRTLKGQAEHIAYTLGVV